jgi:hypothetical protein
MSTLQNERLTPERKLELMHGMRQAKNVKEYAEQVGVDRSYLYELRQEMDQAALAAWSQKTVGRPPQAPPPDQEVVRLQTELEQLDEKAKVWEVRARFSGIILEALESVGAIKKTSSLGPIFLRK